jgi:fluoride ion exporter CrcB/FEX
MSYVVLAAWLITAAAGITVLLSWLRRRRPGSTFPVRMVTAHLVAAAVGLGLWVAYLATDRVAPAWLAFIALNVTNGVGDAILTGRWRAVAGTGRSWLADYRRAVGQVLTGRHPRAATLHGLLGGFTFFSTLTACLAASF